MATKAQRNHLAELMDFLVHHEPQIHYRMARPMDITHWPETYMEHLLENGFGMWADCSETITGICKWANLHDPNNLGYNGLGNTSTMLSNPHMRHYTNPKDAMVGAIVIFDPPGAYLDHVCMVRKPGIDPVLFSHGQERGPLYVKCSVEAAYHHKTPVFCSISRL